MLLFVTIISVYITVCGSLGDGYEDFINLQSIIRSRQTNQTPQNQDIPHYAVQIGLSDLTSFIYRAGLTDALAAKGPFTVFGPTDLAFFQLPPESRKKLFINNTLLRELIEYHAISGTIGRFDLENEKLVPSLLPGRHIRINLYRNNTVITASGAKVISLEHKASNGIIHTIDSVMLPPPGTIIYLVQNLPGFSILQKAISITGLAETLEGPGPFTFFAPSDAAFLKLPEKILQSLLNNISLLTDVLLNHSVNGTLYSAGLYNNERILTINRQSLRITVDTDGVRVNDAMVTMADQTVTNGVVHVIDAVLLLK